MKRAVFAGVLAVGVVLTGCSQSTPPPTQFSTVTMSPGAETPSASGTGSIAKSSTPDPAKVAEAEQIIREFYERFFDAEVLGGSSTLPVEIAPLVAPPISTNTQQLLAQQKLQGWRAAPKPRPRISVSGVLPGVSRGGSDFVLGVCIDGSKTPLTLKDGSSAMGVVVESRAYFKSIDGQLKYFDAQSKKVSSC